MQTGMILLVGKITRNEVCSRLNIFLTIS